MSAPSVAQYGKPERTGFAAGDVLFIVLCSVFLTTFLFGLPLIIRSPEPGEQLRTTAKALIGTSGISALTSLLIQFRNGAKRASGYLIPITVLTACLILSTALIGHFLLPSAHTIDVGPRTNAPKLEDNK
jgi:hypothetical protein